MPLSRLFARFTHSRSRPSSHPFRLRRLVKTTLVLALAGFGVPAVAIGVPKMGGGNGVAMSQLSSRWPHQSASGQSHLLLAIHVRRAAAVHQGGAARLKIGIRVSRGDHHFLNRRAWLSVSGLPQGATAAFQSGHRFILPGDSTTLIIRTARGVHTGRYTIRIHAVRYRGELQGPSKAHTSRALPPAQATAQLALAVVRHQSGHGGGSAGSGSTSGSGTGSGGTGNGGGASDGGSVPTHVPTWAYDDGCNGGDTASAALVRQWVTYAESSCGPDATKVLSDCQGPCTAVQYLDANWIYKQGSLPVAADAHENWWLHEPGHSDSGHRIYKDFYGGGNLLNQSVTGVQDWFRNYVQTNYNSYPALFMDDTGPSLNAQLYHSGYTTSDELSTDRQLQTAHEDFAAAMTHSDGSHFLQIDNSLSINPYLPTPFPMLDHSGIHGVLAEGAPISDGDFTGFYSTMLDDMAYIDHTSDDFMVMLSYDSSGSSAARTTQTATEWLGYSGDHVVSWADLEYNSNHLSIWPEQGIVPENPVQTMSSPGGSGCLEGTGKVCSSGGALDLQVAPGVYRREFAQCYNQGTSFGPCAAIVNSTGSSVTIRGSWLSQSYGHRITLNGGDVQSGGSVNLSGASFTPGSSAVPAHDAVLLAG